MDNINDIKSFIKITRPAASGQTPPSTTFDISTVAADYKVKCVKCGKTCITDLNVPLEFTAWETAFGYYCTACHEQQDNYEALVESFESCCSDPGRIETSLDFNEDGNELAEMIQAWNRAKKDPRFIYSIKEVKDMERRFIANAKECDIEISPSVFSLAAVQESLTSKRSILKMKVGKHMSKGTDFAKEFKLFETLNADKQIKSTTKLAEAASSTNQTVYDRLYKKFEEAIRYGDQIWARYVIELGLDLGYYAAPVAKKLLNASQKNIHVVRVKHGNVIDLCRTGDLKIDSAFSNFIEKEANYFDSKLGDDLYNETIICYKDGSHKYLNVLHAAFEDNIDDVECVVGIDYASGADICWIRGEDRIKDLEIILNI
jgi:hypothetical protein